MGGGISKSVAAKAWKSAQKAARKATKESPRVTPVVTPAATPAAAGITVTKPKIWRCYYCNEVGHRGGQCPKKKAGLPCHPDSRKAKWDKEKAAKRKGKE